MSSLEILDDFKWPKTVLIVSFKSVVRIRVSTGLHFFALEEFMIRVITFFLLTTGKLGNIFCVKGYDVLF